MAADEQEATTEEALAKGGGLRSWLIYALIALMAGGSGFAAAQFCPQWVGGQTPLEDEDRPPQAAFVPLGDIVVNLNENQLNRYLRISVTLQVDLENQPVVSKIVEMKTAILKSWLLTYLSDKGMDDIRGAAGQNRIRREIHDNFNDLLFSDGFDRINDILFEEFNVQ